MPDLAFDDATHTYTVDGIEVPSVTQVLDDAGLVDKRWYTDEACLRGRYVDVATELHDAGKLDWSKVPAQYVPYVEAWVLFRKESQIQILGQKERRYSAIYHYAGECDKRVLWGGETGILDIKTGARPAWYALQLAGYIGLQPVATGRIGVVLKPNGGYSMKHYSYDPGDWDAFRGALAVCHWKRNHK